MLITLSCNPYKFRICNNAPGVICYFYSWEWSVFCVPPVPYMDCMESPVHCKTLLKWGKRKFAFCNNPAQHILVVIPWYCFLFFKSGPFLRPCRFSCVSPIPCYEMYSSEPWGTPLALNNVIFVTDSFVFM